MGDHKMFAIETQDLRKVYGDKVAVRGLTLQVREGEAFGFLGPNGAGKTTSIKMLLGLASPTSGRAVLFGTSIRDPRLRAKVGFLPEHFRFHEWLTGREFLQLHGRLYSIDPTQLRARTRELLDLVGLTASAGKQLRTYSKGMLQRIGLAQALLNYPRLVFLDEPTSGLDPAGRRMVRDIIKDLRAQGITVFLNSHLLSEVEVTCDRVAFIKHGEVLRVDELKKLTSAKINVHIRATGITDSILQELARFGADVRAIEEGFTMEIATDSVLPEIVRFLVARNMNIYAITPEKVSLEDLFLAIVGKEGEL